MSDLIQAGGVFAPLPVRVLRPRGDGWTYRGDARAAVGSEWPMLIYDHQCGIRACSSIEVAENADGGGSSMHYHVSFSRQDSGATARCDANDSAWALQCFGLDGWEEDNHVPGGKVRNFWRPVAERLVGVECPCKANEPAIREDGGDFVWRPAPEARDAAASAALTAEMDRKAATVSANPEVTP